MIMNVVMLLFVVFYLIVVSLGNINKPKISIIVVSQPLTKYFTDRYLKFEANVTAQLASLDTAEIKLSHTNYNEDTQSDWTISPRLIREKSFYATQDWIVVCSDETRLDLHSLASFLSGYNPKENLLIGGGLYDEMPTIIHHYAFFDHDAKFRFEYPNRAAGYVISGALVHSLIEKWESHREHFDFRIDVDFEIAKFARDELGVNLNTQSERFCLGPKKEKCLTWLSEDAAQLKCDVPGQPQEIFFAVKTCEKFLKERVPIIKSTWAKDAGEHLAFFAELHDPSVPTIRLPVKNQEMGHCAKLREILAWSRQHRRGAAWLVIADDDTLLNVPKMRDLLACLDPQEAVVVGERYGYRTADGHGYDYVTGGGSIVLSAAAVSRLADAAAAGQVRCQADDSPDDMALGIWATSLQIPILHCPLFHQARPSDYPRQLLSQTPAVSFHKFWNCDPLEVFRKYLQQQQPSSAKPRPDEL